MRTSRRPARRELNFDALEGKALLSTMAVGPRAVPAQVTTQQVDPATGIDIKKDEFDNSGGDTAYDLTLQSGRYKFVQNYEMDIDRVKGDGTAGIDAVSALLVFQDRLATRLAGVGATTNAVRARQVTLQQADGEYVIEKERFKQRGGKTTYQLTIRSGDYRYTQEYTMNIKRVNRGPNNGIGAFEAVDLFAEKLAINVENLLASRPIPIARARA